MKQYFIIIIYLSILSILFINVQSTTIDQSKIKVIQINDGLQVVISEKYNQTIHSPILFNGIDCKYENNSKNVQDQSSSSFSCTLMGIPYLEGYYPFKIGNQSSFNIYFKHQFPIITNIQYSLDYFGPKIEMYGYFGNIGNATIYDLIKQNSTVVDKVQVSIGNNAPRDCRIYFQSPTYIYCYDLYISYPMVSGEQSLSVTVNGYTKHWTRLLYYSSPLILKSFITDDYLSCGTHGSMNLVDGSCKCDADSGYGGFQCQNQRLYINGSYTNQEFNSNLFHILNSTLMQIQEVDGSTHSDSWYGDTTYDAMTYKSIYPSPSNMIISNIQGVSPTIPDQDWSKPQTYSVLFKYHPNSTTEIKDASHNPNNDNVEIYLNMTVTNHRITLTLSISNWNFSKLENQLCILTKYQLNYDQPFEQPDANVFGTTSALDKDRITKEQLVDGYNQGHSRLNTFTWKDTFNKVGRPLIQIIANKYLLFNIESGNVVSDNRQTFTMQRIESIDKQQANVIVSQYIPQFKQSLILSQSIETFIPNQTDQPQTPSQLDPKQQRVFKFTIIFTVSLSILTFISTIFILFYFNKQTNKQL